MSPVPAGYIYSLLPEYYRRRDLQLGQPLGALLAIAEHELNVLESNVEDLYDNWFIETCADWCVPYVADLLGVEGLADPGSNLVGQRARVANTLGDRQRKGVAAVVERVAQDATNWDTQIAAGVDLLSRTQNVKHVDPHHGRTVALDDELALAELGGPFDRFAHTGGIRSRFDLGQVGVFVWRLRSYATHWKTRAGPRNQATDRFWFNVFGFDAPVFNAPRSAASRWSIVDTVNLPIPLTVQLLADDLSQYARQYANTDQPPMNSRFYGPDRGLFIVRDPGTPDELAVTPLQVASRTLDPESPEDVPLDWSRPPLLGKEAAVDVDLGRLAFRPPRPTAVELGHAYGFSCDLGGGPYDRRTSLSLEPPGNWQGTVGGSGYSSLEAAIADWDVQAYPTATIWISDNGVFDLPAGGLTIVLPSRGGLVIAAANGYCPALIGDVRVVGQATPLDSNATRYLDLNGLLLDGQITLAGELTLRVAHSCLVPRPARDSVAWEPALAGSEPPLTLRMSLARSVAGPLRLPATANQLRVSESILDTAGSPDSLAIAAPIAAPGEPPYGPLSTLDQSTVFGAIWATELGASQDCVFTDEVMVLRRQLGGIAYSYVPPGSQTPRRTRCQPDLALADQTDGPARRAIEARIRPRFTSTMYSQPAYAQLDQTCPAGITTGSHNGSEMGVFSILGAPRRTGNLQSVLEAYLPAGLTPHVTYAT
jgi:hypothetical protein